MWAWAVPQGKVPFENTKGLTVGLSQSWWQLWWWLWGQAWEGAGGSWPARVTPSGPAMQSECALTCAPPGSSRAWKEPAVYCPDNFSPATPPRAPEVSVNVLSWLRTVLQWDLGKASVGSLEGRSCPAMGLLSAQKGGVVSLCPVFPQRRLLSSISSTRSVTGTLWNGSRSLTSEGPI